MGDFFGAGDFDLGSKDGALDGFFNEKTEYEPETLYGPALPPGFDDEPLYGPALPPGFDEYEPETSYGPALPPGWDDEPFMGPALPPNFGQDSGSDNGASKPSIDDFFGNNSFYGGAW